MAFLEACWGQASQPQVRPVAVVVVHVLVQGTRGTFIAFAYENAGRSPFRTSLERLRRLPSMPTGRAVTILDANGWLKTLTYDNANRLTNQHRSGEFATFTMDAIWNITVKNHQGSNPMTMTYDAGSRLVTMLQGTTMTTFTFDTNGNQTTDNVGGVTTGYVYDRENRLKKITNPDFTVSTYSYDGDGLRRTKQEPGQAVRTMVWDRTDYLMEY